MEMSPPPYKRHLKTFAEFIAEHCTPESAQRLTEAYDQGERDLIPIQERLDALTYAEAEGWTPTRGIENQLRHLRNVVCGRYVAKYLKDILETLQEAEADLATWPTQRDERLAEREREEAEAEERRKAEAVLRARHEEFYAAMEQLNVSPPRWLDNQIATWGLAA